MLIRQKAREKQEKHEETKTNNLSCNLQIGLSVIG